MDFFTTITLIIIVIISFAESDNNDIYKHKLE